MSAQQFIRHCKVGRDGLIHVYTIPHVGPGDGRLVMKVSRIIILNPIMDTTGAVRGQYWSTGWDDMKRHLAAAVRGNIRGNVRVRKFVTYMTPQWGLCLSVNPGENPTWLAVDYDQ